MPYSTQMVSTSGEINAIATFCIHIMMSGPRESYDDYVVLHRTEVKDVLLTQKPATWLR